MNNVPKPKCSIITFTAGFWSNVSQSKTSHRMVFFDAYIVGVVFNIQWDVQVLLTKKFGRSSVTRHDCLKEPTHLQVHELPPLRLSKMRDKTQNLRGSIAQTGLSSVGTTDLAWSSALPLLLEQQVHFCAQRRLDSS